MPNAIAVGVKNGEQLSGRCLHDRAMAERIVGFAAKRSRTALLSRRNAVRGHFIHDLLPCPRSHPGIMRREISASQAKVERRLTVRLVHRVEQPLGLSA